MESYLFKAIILSFYLYSSLISAQNGKILEKQSMLLSDSTISILQKADPELAKAINHVEFYEITYLSDSLKVKGFFVKPSEKGDFPCIISNSGGIGDFSKWNEVGIDFFLGKLASWGYVVVASQYRGTEGGEGLDENASYKHEI